MWNIVRHKAFQTEIRTVFNKKRNEKNNVLLKDALYVVQLLSITRIIGCDTCLDNYYSISNVKAKKLFCQSLHTALSWTELNDRFARVGKVDVMEIGSTLG